MVYMPAQLANQAGDASYIFSTIGTGSIMGGLLQVVWLLVDIAIYAPFVIAGNKVKDEYDEEEA